MAKFYMQRCDLPSQVIKELGSSFQGLAYVSAEGLSDKGKPKNVVVEKYSDSPEDRVYIPSQVYHTPNDVTLTFVFIGKNMRKSYDEFCRYISKGVFFYWDTVRNRKVKLVLLSPIKPADDALKISPNYLKVPFTFTNLWGESKIVNDNGVEV